MKIKSVFFLITLLALGQNVQSQSRDGTATKIAELAGAYAGLEMFSGVVLVAQRGDTIYSEAFGEANKDYHVPNRPGTRYNIGSIGKTFTAVATMLLVEDGSLSLSDTLGKFYPECPFADRDTITVHQLLTHTAGLGDYMEHESYKARLASLHSIADVLLLVFEQQPVSPPGERFQYSNSGFLLLGGIIERV